MKNKQVDIVIADDHPLFRKGLRDVIQKENDFRILAEAGDGEEGLNAIKSLEPDIAVLDLDMPKLNGLDLAEKILGEDRSLSVIILTMYDEEDLFERAMELGVMGYILKDSAGRDIVQGIRTVARGEYFISPSMSNSVIKDKASLNTNLEKRLGLFLLTPMERRVLRLVAQYKTSPEIAEELGISKRTAHHHRENICSKLKLTGRYALSRFAQKYRDHI